MRLPVLVAAIVWITAVDVRFASADPLAKAFQDPPMSARPRVWWHWMNGNVTEDGIAKDLDWMSRVGIGGLQNFDANLMTPQVVDERLVYMTPPWKDAFRFAARKADELGLELAIAASPGWSETGGPWVEPRDGLKKVVWSELVIDGGQRFQGVLPAPPSVTGPYQDLARDEALLAALQGGEHFSTPQYYSDIAVLAHRVSAPETLPAPDAVYVDGEPIEAGAVIDDSLATSVQIERPRPGSSRTVELEYAEPQTVRSASLLLGAAESIDARLEAGGEGTWTTITKVPLSTVPTTVGFAPVTARRFRIVLEPGEAAASATMSPAPGADTSLLKLLAPADELPIADFRLSAEAKIDQFEIKAAFALVPDYYALDSGELPDVEGIAPDAVVDLSAYVDEDGRIDWLAPEGTWRILRLGWSLTGKTNHPASAEATGLEVDKYDADAVRAYLEHYLRLYEDTVGDGLIGDRGVRALLTDSIEVGPSNWTPELIAHFERLRGYDPTPFLPTLTGTIVGSRAESDAFLYDFRRTLAELLATQHYATVAEVAHAHGLVVYGEALEAPRPALGDDMDMRRFADHPMAALWTYPRERGPNPVHRADLKGAASVAHVYGQNIAAAESMTSAMKPWDDVPSELRRVIDFEFANGINRPVIHTSVHQPVDDRQPGLSLLIFGQFFNRHESWAELAGPWIDYIARNSYLLQQGRDVADVAYFYGEESPITALAADGYPDDVPTAHAYDFVNAHALLHVLSVADGDLVAPSGARYEVLYLGGTSQRMTLEVLRRIRDLVRDGATVIGAAPAGSPSLGDDPTEYARLVETLWSDRPVTKLGRGRVIAERDVEAALARIGVEPDFIYSSGHTDSEILFVHRKLEDGDLYFVNNRRNRPESIEARFRVIGKAPEIWRADTGTSEPVSYRTDGAHTVVPLDMTAEDSFFVVFRKPANARQLTVEKPAYAPAADIAGPWDVAFQPGRGAPEQIRLAALRSLSEHADPGVKYFSGVATYTTRFELPAGVDPDQPMWLDLGDVGDLARVTVNGQPVGTAWHPPYRVDVSGAVREGVNTLEVEVANRWVNRMIGDAQPGAKKVAFTTIPTYTADAPLRPSGLIGPVRLLAPVASDG